jgi:hypothetical protein
VKEVATKLAFLFNKKKFFPSNKGICEPCPKQLKLLMPWMLIKGHVIS